MLVAAFALLGPGQALAAPQWLPADTLPSSRAPSVEPAVATDADGNSIAVWIDQVEAPGEVMALYRPRGGPWETTPVDLEPSFPLFTAVAPRAVAMPNGAFIVVWDADRTGNGAPVLRSATRSPSGTWSTEDVRNLNTTGANFLDASTDGSVTVVSPDIGGSSSDTKPSTNAPWGAPQTVSIGTIDDFAAGPDGSAVAVGTGLCAESSCIRASYRPPGGTWGGQETVGITDGRTVTGVAVTANPGASYTVVWGLLTGQSAPVPPGDVLSADRTPGTAGSWAQPQSVAHLELDSPGCSFGCVDVATGSDGRQLAVWQQSGASGDQIAAALRGPGGLWAGPETASGTVTGNGAPHAAITTSGVPVVAWSSNANNSADANGSHRDTAGDWHPVLLGSSQDDSVSLGDLDRDGDGNALTAFRHRGGVFVAGFDAGGPRFSAFSLPSGGSLIFSAAAADNWSNPVSISWLFGDGSGASGATVSHAYGVAGTFVATGTATDAVGNASQESGPVTVTVTTPPPPGCGTTDTDKDGINDGCDTSNGAEKPVPFKTVNATVVSGEVFIKLPAGGAASAAAVKAPKGFVPLEGAETIPVGATLDTAHGRVKVRSAADTRGKKLQTGQFFRGRFVVRQVRIKRRSKKLLTDMRLSGSSFSKACKAKASIAAKRKKRSKKRVRRLFGVAKGAFRTTGRNAAATVRGTRWSIQDRCDGTLVTVQRGRVEVRDKVKRKTIIVRTGHTYLARLR
jgi:hypothetical protein